jgi:hypothetical protein
MPGRKPTWTHEKSQRWRTRYWEALLEMGLDPDELYSRGTVEQHILGFLICQNGKTNLSWVPKEFTTRLYKLTPINVKVESISKEDVDKFTVGVMLRRVDDGMGRPSYEIDGAGEEYRLHKPFVHVPEHTCPDTFYSGIKKLRKICKHDVAAIMTVQEKLPGILEDAGADVDIRPFFVGDEIPPPELLSYYETLIKNPKICAIDRKVKLYEFIRGHHKIYKV